MASIPNFGHWYARSRVLSGRWGYDRRGILDERTLRFFMRREAEELFQAEGFGITRSETVGLPLEPGRNAALAVVDGIGLVVRPSLFAYQLVYELNPSA